MTGFAKNWKPDKVMAMSSYNGILGDTKGIAGLFEHKLSTSEFKGGKAYTEIRKGAIASFLKSGFPAREDEKWRNSDIEKFLESRFEFAEGALPADVDVDKIFACEVPDLDTWLITLLNGHYAAKNSDLRILPQGIIIGSLSRAMRDAHELVEAHLGRLVNNDKNAFAALNSALSGDGVFIYVPDNVIVEKPIQMVNVVNSESGSLFMQPRNLVILGKNSQLQLVHCDDSRDQAMHFTNAVTEFFIGDNASLDHYKMQNINDHSAVLHSGWFTLGRDSRLTTNAISLNGGFIRNENEIVLKGEGADANALGVYLVDKKQHVENHVHVSHLVPRCTSSELFKGILDDYSTAVFTGHILVARDAQKTEAYQSNRNIQLTDKARVNTQPFLEIYADDVKCSHGATVGQLDAEAMFYLKSRGIGEENAKMLLMYAFASEIVQKISILNLRERIDDMIKKRLRGELSICDQCVLHCSKPDQPIQFEIDMSKI